MSLQIITRPLPGMYDSPPVPLAYVKAYRTRRYPPLVDDLMLPPAVAQAPGPRVDAESADHRMPRPWWRVAIERWLGF